MTRASTNRTITPAEALAAASHIQTGDTVRITGVDISGTGPANPVLGGSAQPADVRSGRTFYNDDPLTRRVGTLTDSSAGWQPLAQWPDISATTCPISMVYSDEVSRAYFRVTTLNSGDYRVKVTGQAGGQVRINDALYSLNEYVTLASATTCSIEFQPDSGLTTDYGYAVYRIDVDSLADTVDLFTTYVDWQKGLLFSISAPQSLLWVIVNASLSDYEEFLGDYNHFLECAEIRGACLTLSSYAFQNTYSLQKVTLSEGLETIAEEAFPYCYALRQVHLPSTLTSVEAYAFTEAYALEQITGGSVDTVYADDCFSECHNLRQFPMPLTESVIAWLKRVNPSYAYAELSQSHNGVTTGITVPPGNTEIGDYQFVYNFNLKDKLVLPEGVVSIGASAFSECFNIREIVLPDSLTTIGANAFGDCYNLKVNIPVALEYLDDGAFSNCYSLKTAILPDTVTTIKDNVFEACYRLTAVHIPASAVTLGDFIFSDCESLKVVAMAEGPTTLPLGLFKYCYNLESFIIPSSVTTIGEEAFHYCYFLKQAVIPSGVTLIGQYAFANCLSLESVTIPNGCGAIPNAAFMQCVSLASVSLPAVLWDIGDMAFYGCRSLISLTLPGTVANIGGYAFYECTSLSSINIPPSLLYVHVEAFNFYHCNLGYSAILAIFNQLPNMSGKKITLTGNPGVPSLTGPDIAIATNKGWTVVTA
jgi:hypothetical protein